MDQSNEGAEHHGFAEASAEIPGVGSTDPVPGAPSDNVTLTDLTDALDADGFPYQFVPLAGGCVQCSNCDSIVAAADLDVEFARRLEGASDPDDMSMLYAALCPVCGAGGTFVVGFGVNASDVDLDIAQAFAPHN